MEPIIIIAYAWNEEEPRVLLQTKPAEPEQSIARSMQAQRPTAVDSMLAFARLTQPCNTISPRC